MLKLKPLLLLACLLFNSLSLFPGSTADARAQQGAPPEKPTNATVALAGKSVVLNWTKPVEGAPQIRSTVVKPGGLGKQSVLDDDVDSGIRFERDITPFIFGEQLTPSSYPATLKSVLYISYNREFGPEFPSTIGANFKLWVFSAVTNNNFVLRGPQNEKIYPVTITKEPQQKPSREFEDFNEFVLPEPLTITSGSFYVALQYVNNGTSALTPDGSRNFNFAFDRDSPSTAFLSTNGGQSWRGVDITIQSPTAGIVSADFPLFGRVELTTPAAKVVNYNVYRSNVTPVDPATAKKVATIEPDKTSFTDEPETADGITKYYYAITAVYEDGRESGPSNEVSAVPGMVSGDTVAPVVKVVAPNGGEAVDAGKPLSIAWTASDNTAVVTQSIDLSTNGGGAFETPVTSGLAGNIRAFSFNLPTTLASATARIRVSAKDAAGNTGTDTSDADFSVREVDPTPPTVRVLGPNGGEKLKGAVAFKIAWQSTDNVGVVSHDIRFSTDNGTNYPISVVTGLAGNVQDFDYLANMVQGKVKTCKVRVIARDAAGNEGQDDSDGPFLVKGKK